VCYELYKLVAPWKTGIEAYKCGFVNLALPLFAFSEPIACAKRGNESFSWTIWDKITLKGPLTLEEFMAFFAREHKVEVQMISAGVSILYSFFSAKPERKKLAMEKLVEVVTQSPVPKGAVLTFEVCCLNENEEDVELPPIDYKVV
jgi:ubiquitin-activating enzyme E1